MLRATVVVGVICLWGSIALAAKPSVQFRNSSRKGTVWLSVKNASVKKVRFMVPEGVARKIVAASRSGVKLFTARDSGTGAQVRIVAGQGKNAVIIDRTRRGGPNGQTGYHVLRFQQGVGKGARAVFLGQARDGENMGRGRFNNRSVYTPHQIKQIINPVTLKANKWAKLKSSYNNSSLYSFFFNSKASGPQKGQPHVWYSINTDRKVTTDVTRPLRATSTGPAINPLSNVSVPLTVAPTLRSRFGL